MRIKLDPSSSHYRESPLFKFTKDDFATQGENSCFVKHLMICLVIR
jgi:hypothetical protein